jgi:hypothetical protein
VARLSLGSSGRPAAAGFGFLHTGSIKQQQSTILSGEQLSLWSAAPLSLCLEEEMAAYFF